MWKRLVVFSIIILCLTKTALGFWILNKQTGRFERAVKGGAKDIVNQVEDAKKLTDKAADDALSEWLAVYNRDKQGPYAPEALYNIASILMKQGKLYEAHLRFKDLLEMFPYSEYVLDALQKEIEIAKKMMEGYDRPWWDITKPIENPAKQIFELVLKASPYSKEGEYAKYMLGVFYLRNKMYQDAIKEFDEFLQSYPESTLSAEAEYQRILAKDAQRLNSSYDQKFAQDILDMINDFVKKHPNSEFIERLMTMKLKAEEAIAGHLFKIANFYRKQGKGDAARVYFEKIIKEYPETSFARKSNALLKE